MAETRMAFYSNLQAEKTVRRTTGLEFSRRFTDGKVNPFDAVEWERRTAPVLSLTQYSGSRTERRDLARCDAHGSWVEWWEY